MKLWHVMLAVALIAVLASIWPTTRIPIPGPAIILGPAFRLVG